MTVIVAIVSIVYFPAKWGKRMDSWLIYLSGYLTVQKINGEMAILYQANGRNEQA